jgi:hypothetical protein
VCIIIIIIIISSLSSPPSLPPSLSPSSLPPSLQSPDPLYIPLFHAAEATVTLFMIPPQESMRLPLQVLNLLALLVQKYKY